MKRTLLLAGCLLLCAGCAKKAAPQQRNGGTLQTWQDFTAQPTGDSGGTEYAQWTRGTAGTEMDICEDQEGHWLSCPDEQQAEPLPPMVAPTPLKCPKRYVEAWLFSYEEANAVCVTPAFIAELEKANGEK